MSSWDNYRRIRERIDAIAVSAGRKGEDVRIIAVSKTFSESAVQEAIDAGIRTLGENKVQEAKKKIPLLRGDFSFHMIGHLQSNKAREAVALFDVIHSLDKFSTAEKVNAEAAAAGKIQKVLIQVNVSGESTKSGVSRDECPDLAGRILAFPNLQFLGLMTMAPFTDDESAVRASFRGAKKLLEEINRALDTQFTELSMGMSADYGIAVEEGATMVRIGSAIFGERVY